MVAVSTTAPTFAQDAPSKNPPQELTVIAGPLESERRELLGMINAAEKKGVNIRNYMENFKYIEDRIAHGATELTLQPRLERVKQALEDQLRMREFYQNEQTKPITQKVVKATEKENTNKSKLLTLEEARNFMVTLINKDRAKYKLKPVSLDLTASLAGQKHTDEMAVSKYMAHWDLTGKKPSQRYTECGGIHGVSENIAYSGHNVGNFILENSMISASEIQKLHELFMKEIPPNDGHRQQILTPEHNKVGIGISRARTKSGHMNVCLAQEFVNCYGQYEKIPLILTPGKSFILQGKLAPEFTLYDIRISWEPLPKQMSVEDLEATHSYSEGVDEFRSVADEEKDLTGIKITKKKNVESFSIKVIPSNDWKPGLYYFQIFAHRKKQNLILVSSRVSVLNPPTVTDKK